MNMEHNNKKQNRNITKVNNQFIPRKLIITKKQRENITIEDNRDYLGGR